MFRSRRRPPPQAPQAPTSAAASAAAQAFLANRAPNAQLSSAAAAAALRSHTTTPMPVGDMQTKRTQRRGSTSSNGSAPGLVRRGSSGSMTERTFRDPSPVGRTPRDVPPPIPPVPKEYGGLVRRPSSAEPPQRVFSPPPVADRGVSLDRKPGLPRRRKKKQPDVQPQSDEPRGSVNFSRPMSPTSPATASMPTPPDSQQSTRSRQSAIDAENTRHSVNEAAAAPVRKKKKKLVTTVVEGSHLAEGQTSMRPKGSEIDANGGPSNQPPATGPSADFDGSVPPVPPKAYNRLNKRPSMVREDPEGEASQTVDDQAAAKEHSLPAPSNDVNNTPTQQPGRLQSNGFAHKRQASLSPNRGTRFAIHSDEGTFKHQPPERSKSPTKSALKQSSPRGNSPEDVRSNSTSRDDTLSVGSDDFAKQRKKSVRVSFDDDAVVVGQAADASTTNSPIVFSPQNKDPATRQWPSRKSEDPLDFQDEHIRPTPILPSFGSVRGRRDHDEGSTEDSRLGASSDHAISNVVANDASLKRQLAPLAPEVTSVEGSGYHSDSEDEAVVPEPVQANARADQGLEHQDLTRPSEPSDTRGDGANTRPVPVIAVLPATPGVENEDEAKQHLGMPGEFPEADPLPWTVAQPPPAADTAETFPQAAGISEPPECVASQHKREAPVVGQITQSLIGPGRHDNESDDTGDSIYSDAAEDASDFEGDGFGSIDAIVDSPVVESFTLPASTTEEPNTERTDLEPSHQADVKSTPALGKSGRKGQGAEDLMEAGPRKAKPLQDAPRPKHANGTRRDSKPMRKSMRGSDGSDAPDIAARPRDRPMNFGAPPLRARGETKNQSPRSAAPKAQANTTMRMSMRDGGRTQPTSSRLRPPRQAPSPPLRATSDDPFTSPTQPPASKRFVAPAPALERQASNGSDSSSSFKKARKHPGSSGFTMRKSMRSTEQPTERVLPVPEPPVRQTPAAKPSSPNSRMRTTMRGAPSTKPTQASPGFLAKARGPKARTSSTRPKSSRFGMSDDEDERPQHYGSRFGDSSDEDEPASLHLAPVRGIPRAGNDGDSTDLEDSDDNRSRARAAPAVRSPPIRHGRVPAEDVLNGLDVSGLGSPGVAALAGPSSEKRKSWFSLRGRKKDGSRVGKSNMESAARLDTHLERSPHERARLPQQDNDNVIQENAPTTAVSPLPSPSPRAGKLVRRKTPQRMASDSWPFPDSPSSTGNAGRPITSDGAAATARPGLGSRQNTGATDLRSWIAPSEQPSKRKRFPMLRKAFGMQK